MFLKEAFNFLSSLSSRKMSIVRVVGTPISEVEIYVSPSNYYRNLASLEDTRVQSTEFVIASSELTRVGFPDLTEGDILRDSELGDMTMVEVRPMFVSGTLVGYRVRVG